MHFNKISSKELNKHQLTIERNIPISKKPYITINWISYNHASWNKIKWSKLYNFEKNFPILLLKISSLIHYSKIFQPQESIIQLLKLSF